MGEARRRGTFEERKHGSKLRKWRRLSYPKVGKDGLWLIEAARDMRRISRRRPNV